MNRDQVITKVHDLVEIYIRESSVSQALFEPVLKGYVALGDTDKNWVRSEIMRVMNKLIDVVDVPQLAGKSYLSARMYNSILVCFKAQAMPDEIPARLDLIDVEIKVIARLILIAENSDRSNEMFTDERLVKAYEGFVVKFMELAGDLSRREDEVLWQTRI